MFLIMDNAGFISSTVGRAFAQEIFLQEQLAKTGPWGPEWSCHCGLVGFRV